MSVIVHESKTATVRIHTGKLTEAERKAAIEKAAKEFAKAIMKNGGDLK